MDRRYARSTHTFGVLCVARAHACCARVGVFLRRAPGVLLAGGAAAGIARSAGVLWDELVKSSARLPTETIYLSYGELLYALRYAETLTCVLPVVYGPSYIGVNCASY